MVTNFGPAKGWRELLENLSLFHRLCLRYGNGLRFDRSFLDLFYDTSLCDNLAPSFHSPSLPEEEAIRLSISRLTLNLSIVLWSRVLPEMVIDSLNLLEKGKDSTKKWSGC